VQQGRKGKKKKNSDGGRRQGRKTEDKPSSVKRKTGQKKNGKDRGEGCGGTASRRAVASNLATATR
jgi:hypothetical protein